MTQVVFTALYGNDVWDEEERKVNLAMLQNVLVSTTPTPPRPTRLTPQTPPALLATRSPTLTAVWSWGRSRCWRWRRARCATSTSCRAGRPTLPRCGHAPHLLDGSHQQIAGACCQDLLHWPAKESHTSEDGSDTASAKTSIWRAPLPPSPRGFLPASVS